MSTQAAAKDPRADIAATLRARRRELGITQEELADLAGVSVRFLGELERGKPSVRLDHVTAVARALGLKLEAR